MAESDCRQSSASLKITATAIRALWCCLALCAGCSRDDAATGRITDARTGQPVAGATVYAVWYFHPIQVPVPVEVQHVSRACGGAAIFTTDANGYYRVDAGTRAAAALHEAAFWVAAPGHYDKVAEPPGVAEAHWRGWSRALEPLDSLSIDEKLTALRTTETADSCVAGRVQPFEMERRFESALRRVANHELCADLAAAPAKRTFLSLYPSGLQSSALWRLFVDPHLSTEADDAPISLLAVHNACAVLADDGNDAGSRSMHVNFPPILRINVLDADSRTGVANLPVRVLWAARAIPARSIDRDHRDFAPVYSIAGVTGGDGSIDVLVTQAMLDAQPQDTRGLRERLNYAAVPYANDRLAFDATEPDLSSLCTPTALLGALPQLHTNIRFGPFRVRCAAAPYADADAAAGAGAGRPGLRLSGGLPQVAPDPLLSEIDALAKREMQRRAQIAPRAISPNAAAADAATIYTYSWQWPASALLPRSYDLLTLNADTEADPQALLQLQRTQVHAALDAVCAGERDAQMADGYAVLRLLWWEEAAASGVDEANRNVQQRMLSWDNGERCSYRDGKWASQGPTLPPRRLLAGEVCEAWRKIASAAATSTASTAHGLEELQLDYAARPGACTHLPRSGASL